MKSALLLSTVLLAEAAHAQSLTAVADFGTNPGNLRMYEYVPSSMGAAAPLVVLLPGCNQAASAFASDGGWLDVADNYGVALVVAEQKMANNIGGCFNWFQAPDTTRDQGEARSITQMILTAIDAHDLDESRVFVAGISAGGCMTAVMLATYPDLFAGGAIFAGVPFRCATNTTEAWSCMDPGKDKTPSAWGDLVRAASNNVTDWPTVSLWHGTSDNDVVPLNLAEAREQWLDVHGLDATADAEEAVGAATHRVWDGVETWEVTGMGHAVPVDPAGGCGQTGPFSANAGICAPAELVTHWGLEPPADDGAPPDGGSADGGPADGGPADGGPGDTDLYPGDTLAGGDPSPTNSGPDRGCAAALPSVWLLLLALGLVRRFDHKR